jgi:hypothetical protein
MVRVILVPCCEWNQLRSVDWVKGNRKSRWAFRRKTLPIHRIPVNLATLHLQPILFYGRQDKRSCNRQAETMAADLPLTT